MPWPEVISPLRRRRLPPPPLAPYVRQISDVDGRRTRDRPTEGRQRRPARFVGHLQEAVYGIRGRGAARLGARIDDDDDDGRCKFLRRRVISLSAALGDD